jgi:hypothetical protein
MRIEVDVVIGPDLDDIQVVPFIHTDGVVALVFLEPSCAKTLSRISMRSLGRPRMVIALFVRY